MAAEAGPGTSGRAHRSHLLRCVWKCRSAGNRLLTCVGLEVGCRTDGCNMMQPFVLCLLLLGHCCVCVQRKAVWHGGQALANCWQCNGAFGYVDSVYKMDNSIEN